MTVYRVQHWLDGRGPYRPGFSKHWSDRDFTGGRKPLPSLIEEFGVGVIGKVPMGYHAGCGCSSVDGIKQWFSERELDRLKAFGFSIVALEVDQVISESENQVFFARKIPLNRDVIFCEPAKQPK